MNQTQSQKPKNTSKMVLLTPQGRALLRSELHQLQTNKRSELSLKLQQAREMDDTDENAEYDALIDEQTMVENRITELEAILSKAQIIAAHTTNGSDIVEIGSIVTVNMDGETQEYTVVGKSEANPTLKKISHESPIGAALFGAKKGDIVTVKTPLRSYQCKIIEIK